MELVFWICIGLVGYTYFGYPVVLSLVAKLTRPYEPQSVDREQIDADDTFVRPTVTVVIAAFNEESCIGERIENVLRSDYPMDRLEVLVGSDGSTDRTAEIIQSHASEIVRPKVFTRNRGKINVLNDLVDAASGELIVMTDANTVFDRSAIRLLAEHFENSQIGAVSGELHLVREGDNQNQDGLYWRYEQYLKSKESRIGALLGANGAIYAIRKNLYQALPTDTIVDDFQIVMNVARARFKVFYEPAASATEEVAPDLSSEHRRRIRIGTGNYQALVRSAWALSPTRGALCFSFVSHKLLRWFVPHLLILTFVTNLFLVSQYEYALLFAAQVVGYSYSIFAIRRIWSGRRVDPISSVFAFFVSMNVALFQGFLVFLRGGVSAAWARTER